jgi:hypothetical protein
MTLRSQNALVCSTSALPNTESRCNDIKTLQNHPLPTPLAETAGVRDDERDGQCCCCCVLVDWCHLLETFLCPLSVLIDCRNVLLNEDNPSSSRVARRKSSRSCDVSKLACGSVGDPHPHMISASEAWSWRVVDAAVSTDHGCTVMWGFNDFSGRCQPGRNTHGVSTVKPCG